MRRPVNRFDPGYWDRMAGRNTAPGRRETAGMLRTQAIALVLPLLALALSGCAAAVAGAPAANMADATAYQQGVADRQVCVDLDARGGGLYRTFVVPMMAGAAGEKSIDVDVMQMTEATRSVAGIDPGRVSSASPAIADDGQRLLAAAGSFRAYDHFEGTALLTSFVGLAVACQNAGIRPTWFDADALRNH
jgi:hypothetical protein